jgi:hypothetical protein
MTGVRRLMAVAIVVAWWAEPAAQVACSRPQTAAGQPELCELKIEGHSILSLTLLGGTAVPGDGAENLAGQKHVRPGKSLWLPAGRYWVERVELEGDYESSSDYARDDGWFELAPGKPHQLVIGAPLSPRATVTRHGKFLEMSYDLVDAAGRGYRLSSGAGQRPVPPRFTVYKNDEVLGAGSFEYG